MVRVPGRAGLRHIVAVRAVSRGKGTRIDLRISIAIKSAMAYAKAGRSRSTTSAVDDIFGQSKTTAKSTRLGYLQEPIVVAANPQQERAFPQSLQQRIVMEKILFDPDHDVDDLVLSELRYKGNS